MSEANGEPLPMGWIRARLGDIVLPRSGKMDPRAVPTAQFIGMEHIESETMRLLGTVPAATMKSSANTFQPTDVLYGRLRPYLNKVYQPEFSGLCSGEFIVIPESCAVSGRFLKYRMNAGDFVRFASRLNAGDRPRVDFEQINIFTIDLPPKNEQLRIADVLDELLSDLDAGVAALNRAKVKLRHYRAAVLKAAVEGSLTTEWRKQHPDAEPASALLTRILIERRKRWEQEQLRKYADAGKQPPANWKSKYQEPAGPNVDELPELPTGWCWTTAEQLCDFITKGTTPSGKFAPTPHGEIPFIKVQHLSATGSFHFWESPSFVAKKAIAGPLVRSKVYPEDILMNIVGPPLGQVVIVPNAFQEWNLNQAIAIFRCIPGVPNKYLARCLQTNSILLYALRKTKTTAGQVNITLEVTRQIPIPLASLQEQEAIVEAVEEQLSIIDHLETDLDAKLKSAQGLRQSILRHAFTGKLVPQDSSDEPASELLKRIAAERAERERRVAAEKRARQPHKPKKKAKRGS